MRPADARAWVERGRGMAIGKLSAEARERIDRVARSVLLSPEAAEALELKANKSRQKHAAERARAERFCLEGCGRWVNSRLGMCRTCERKYTGGHLSRFEQEQRTRVAKELERRSRWAAECQRRREEQQAREAAYPARVVQADGVEYVVVWDGSR
jgi:hypothetical protein